MHDMNDYSLKHCTREMPWQAYTGRRTYPGAPVMDFEYSPSTRELMRRVDDFMQAHVFPAEAEYEEFVQDPAQALGRPAHGRRAQGQGARRRTLEPVPAARIPALEPGPDQPRIRTARGTHGARRLGLDGLQLQRPGHRQHGGAGALRQRGAAGAVAHPVAGGTHPLGVPDDRAGGGVRPMRPTSNARSSATATITS